MLFAMVPVAFTIDPYQSVCLLTSVNSLLPLLSRHRFRFFSSFRSLFCHSHRCRDFKGWWATAPRTRGARASRRLAKASVGRRSTSPSPNTAGWNARRFVSTGLSWGNNFLSTLLRFKMECVRALAVSPVTVAAWLIQDGEYIPGHTWICPTSAYAMKAVRAEAFYVAATCPIFLTRKHAYVRFFSGGQGGRISFSFEARDHQDREFETMSSDEAKVCSHDRLELEGAMDTARENAVRDIASSRCDAPDVLRFPVAADSDNEDGGPASSPTPRPLSALVRERLRCLVRTSDNNSAGAEELPLVDFPQYIEAGCSAWGNVGMVSCADCEGFLHRTCGTTDEDNATEVRRRSACASKGKGKRRLEAQCIEEGCSVEGNVGMVCCTGCDGDLRNICGRTEYLAGAEIPERICSSCASRNKGKRRMVTRE